jgi:hypothetical protein
MSHLASTTAVAVSATGITVARPAGAGAAHILLAFVWRDFSNGGAMTASAGWTSIGSLVHSGFVASQINVFWALGDVAALTFSAPAASEPDRGLQLRRKHGGDDQRSIARRNSGR